MAVDRYAVFGNPVAHSLSPFIHHEFAKLTHQRLVYEKITVPLDGLKNAIDRFQHQGGKGLNITLPFKEEAWRYCHRCSERAKVAQAVNTLTFLESGEIHGDNTDGVGLVRDLTQNQQQTLQHQKILLIGAGGAARGVVQPLMAEQPKRLVIANRTPSKALALAQRFQTIGAVEGVGFEGIPNETFDVIINATSASVYQQALSLPKNIIGAHSLGYDMMYQATPTPFMSWAMAQGANKACDGLGMLVEQAAESFSLWRNCRPPTQSVITRCRQLITKNND